MAPVEPDKGSILHPHEREREWAIFVCLLGGFRLLRGGLPAYIRPGGKTRGLLQLLALRPGYPLGCETVLDRFWPNCPPLRAGESLNSLLYSLHKTLGGCIGGAAPVVRKDRGLRLNIEAGIGVDVVCFDGAADAGGRKLHSGDKDAAAALCQHAIDWHSGDLCSGDDVDSIVERERLRARFLNLLVFLSNYYFDCREYITCQNYAQKLLACDPCREDAHRLIMRCYVRQGTRARAMRQYRLCQQILRAEFDAHPEQATTVLFEQIRLDPSLM